MSQKRKGGGGGVWISLKFKIGPLTRIKFKFCLPVDDIKSFEVFQSQEDLSSVEPGTLLVEGSHFVDERQKLAVFGVAEDEIQALVVLKGAMEFDEKRSSV